LPPRHISLAGLARPAGDGAGEAREPGDVGSRLGLDEVLLVELPLDVAAGDGEVGALHEEVVLRVPHPVLPLRLRRVVLLRHLLRGQVGRRDVPVALADDGGGLASADGVHEPVRVVVVHHVEESPPASANCSLLFTTHQLPKLYKMLIKTYCTLAFSARVLCRNG
jgi:hypothetical protein